MNPAFHAKTKNHAPFQVERAKILPSHAFRKQFPAELCALLRGPAVVAEIRASL